MFFDHDSDKDKLREEKENDNYSVRSSLSRASKSILEMNTNELLGCKIPVSPVRITPEGERSLDTQQFRGSLGEQTPRND